MKIASRQIRLSFTLMVCAVAVTSSMAEDPHAPNEIIICFKPEVAKEACDAFVKGRGMALAKGLKPELARRVGGKERGVSLGLFRHPNKSTEELLASVKNQPEVLYAEPNYYRALQSTPNDPDFSLLWGLHNTGQNVNGVSGVANADINYPEAMAMARPEAGDVVVAVLDTGVNISHPDLAGQIWTNPYEIPNNGIDDDSNGYVDDVVGYDFATRTAVMTDNHGHGTHVAGTIGAATNNGIGMTGVATRVKIMALRFADANNDLTAAGAIQAYYYAAALKNRGVNLVAVNASYGGPGFSQSEYNAIKALNDAGVLVCAAAGNYGTNNDSAPYYPTNYNLPNIISVAALSQNNSMPDFSNYGASTVDLAAPGVNIRSTLPLNLNASTPLLELGGDVYTGAMLTYSGSIGESGITGAVIDCGRGYATDFPASVNGNIALIERGDIYFSEKVQNAMNAGAKAALIYDNTSPTTDGWSLGSPQVWIPAVQLTRGDGLLILNSLPRDGALTMRMDPSRAYVYQQGTSMAAPHVTGAVAFTAVNFPNDSMSKRKARILNNVRSVPGLSGAVSTGGALDLLGIINSDGDSLPDWWEEDEVGNLSLDGALDSDGDGYTDFAEYLSLTDPNSASSFFRFAAAGFQEGQGMMFRFPSVSGRSYQLMGTDTLAPAEWSPVGDEITGNGEIIEIEDPQSLLKDKRFYRLEIR